MNNPRKNKDYSHKQNSIKRIWWIVGVGLFAFILYGNTINHEYTLDDDIPYLKNEFTQKGTKGIKDIFSWGYLYGFNKRNNQSYRPVTLLSFALEHEISPNNPRLSHFISVLLYAITAILVLLLTLRLFKGKNGVVPILITLVYMVHPVHTEVVASVKSRDEMLGFLFLVFSFLLFVKYLDVKKTLYLVASSVVYFIAILSKETSMTFMAVVPFVMIYFKKEPIRNMFLYTVPFAVFFVVYFVIRINVLDDAGMGEPLDIINNSLAAANGFNETYGTNFMIMGKYLYLLFIPYPLVWDYSYNQIPIVTLTDPVVLFILLVYLGIGLFAIRSLFNRNKIGFGIWFFLITISVSCNLFIHIGATLGERFLYTSSFGFAISIVLLILWLLRVGDVENKQQVRKVLFVFVPIILVFSILTIKQNMVWKNQLSLFEAGVKHSPNSARCQFSMGSAYRTEGEKERDPQKRKELYKNAVRHYKKAIEIYPNYNSAYYDLGLIFQNNGNYREALELYKSALKITNDINTLNNIGTIFFQEKQLDSAAYYFNKVLESDPENSNGMANMGAVYHNRGEYKKAISMYNKVMRRQPSQNTFGNLIKALNRVSNNYLVKNELDSAIVYIDESLKLAKNNYSGLFNKAVYLQKSARIDDAILVYEQLYKQNPNDVALIRNMIACYQYKKQFNKVKALQKALQLLQ